MMLSVNGIDLHVEQQGAGSPALVFLHYWGGSSRTWRHVVDRLTPDFRTVAIDQRGWGRSAAPAAGYALADMADDAQAVVEALDLERYIVVGHSMGGKVAQLLASRRPRGLVGIALIAPAPPGPLGLPLDVRQGMVRAYDSRASIVATVEHVLAPDGLDPDDLDVVVADSLAGAVAAKEAWPLSTSQEDIVAALGRIEVPVFILSGEHDRVDPPEVLERELLPRLAKAQMHVLQQVGHLLPYEAPDEIADLVRASALLLPDAGTSRPRCSWCGRSLAAITRARLGRSQLGKGPDSAAVEETQKHEEARHG